MLEECLQDLDKIKEQALLKIKVMKLSPELYADAENDIINHHRAVSSYLGVLFLLEYKFPQKMSGFLSQPQIEERYNFQITGIKRHLHNLINTPKFIEYGIFRPVFHHMLGVSS